WQQRSIVAKLIDCLCDLAQIREGRPSGSFWRSQITTVTESRDEPEKFHDRNYFPSNKFKIQAVPRDAQDPITRERMSSFSSTSSGEVRVRGRAIKISFSSTNWPRSITRTRSPKVTASSTS